MNANFFFMLLLEPLQLHLRVVEVNPHTLKTRLQPAVLSLQFTDLFFKCGELLLSKRELLDEDRCRAMLSDEFLDAVK